MNKDGQVAPPFPAAADSIPQAVSAAAGSSSSSPARLKFSGSNRFQAELRKRVEEFFERTGKRPRDTWQMYLKSAILITSFVTLYVLLVFVAHAWWTAAPLAILLGLSAAAIGFNVQHDGGHQAYSSHPWVNRLAAMTLEVLGGSSYMWHWKHGVLHHTYVNVHGHDSDIELGVLGRLSPHQPRLFFHRWQQFYLWPLYGFMTIKWQLIDDFRDVALGRIGQQRCPRPKGWDLAVFIGGKLVFFSLAIGLPLLLHSIWTVLIFYVVASLVLGVVLSTVFQLAHAVEHTEFAIPDEETGRIENAWAIHQVESTMNFARNSRVASWLLGGLNFQIEHHLLPRICHTHYPAISKVVEETCREFGVKYREHKTVWAGVVSHFRWLRQMGRPDPA